MLLKEHTVVAATGIDKHIVSNLLYTGFIWDNKV